MIIKLSDSNIELKKCPFCGRKNLQVGVAENPFIIWDGAVRGELVAYVICECGAIMKQEADVYIGHIEDDTEEELIKCMNRIAQKWNNRE